MALTGRQGDPHTGATVVVSIVGVLLLVITILSLEALYFSVEDDLYSEIYAEPIVEVASVRAQQNEQLNGYLVLDKEKGIVRIPIDRAIDLFVQENAAGAPVPSQGETLPR